MKLISDILKHRKIATCLFILAGLIFSIPVFAQDPNLYIYLCFGQSNMEGQGTIEQQDRTVDSRFKVMQAVTCSDTRRTKGHWYTATPPLCRCWNGLSPADYFGRTMVANLPDSIRVGVINVSVGGCRIELFDKDIYQDYVSTYTDTWFQDIIKAYDGNPYQYLIDLAKQAQQDGVIKGILLHQGESNTGDQQWPAKVKKIYDDMMNDLELDPESVPLLAGEVVHAEQGGCCSSMNTIIAKLPETLPNSYVISSRGCSVKADNTHFDSAGYREFGRRYAAQMLSIMGVDVTGIEHKTLVADGYGLDSNYPNPFNPETTIKYHIPVNCQVTLSVFDISGRTVSVLVNQTESMGEHTVTFDGSALSSGIYFYRITTGTGFEQTQKMLLVK